MTLLQGAAGGLFIRLFTKKGDPDGPPFRGYNMFTSLLKRVDYRAVLLGRSHIVHVEIKSKGVVDE